MENRPFKILDVNTESNIALILYDDNTMELISAHRLNDCKEVTYE